jgi:hypothetical protein
LSRKSKENQKRSAALFELPHEPAVDSAKRGFLNYSSVWVAVAPVPILFLFVALGLGKFVFFAVIIREEAVPSFVLVIVPLVMFFVFPVVNVLGSGNRDNGYWCDQSASQKQRGYKSMGTSH